MLSSLFQGFILGIAYVAPIGMQNLYVINTAITASKLRAYQVAFITIFFDISLALSCFFGVGALLDRFPAIKGAFLLLGALAVIYIAVGLIRSKPLSNNSIKVNVSLGKVASTCFAVTWLNPQAIIDGSLLLGGFRASLSYYNAILFIIGVSIASLTWFVSLTTFVSMFKNSFNHKIIRSINIACGIIILYFGLKLGYSFLNSIL